MRRLLSGALFGVLGFVWCLSAQPASADPGAVHGLAPGAGLRLVAWGGGGLDLLLPVLASRGCVAGVVWAQDASGAHVGYVPGAPRFVNEAFLTAYPSGLPAGTALTVDCRDPALEAPRVPITVVGRSASVSTRAAVEYCVRYSVAGATDQSCEIAISPGAQTDEPTREYAQRLRACYAAVIVGGPMPECWPR